ncbi:outer membrane protein [Mesorhizobium sp. YM1C-6-2]|uniref:outer membrane protein n=1 Tax=Mesorhizobium sp. YM1C-6-2 TaxID=1827501 RepID=UPI000EF1BA30|nr:outer membrane protein [Mesorhizobium sp. YM1C-6-2]RLP22621.1 porin family protein [Mesorhizobium sp. YM1C-6-2]
MKPTFLAGAMLLGLASSAFGADAIIDEVVVVDTAYNWSGVYVGAQVGYAWGDSDVDFSDIPVTSNPEPNGILGGAYLGYNAQLSNGIVVGVEGDFAFTDLHDSDGLTAPAPLPGQSFEVDVNWTAAVRARLGYAVGRFLPYLAGGVAFADVDHEGFSAPNASAGTGSDTFVGWTIGAGAEYAFTDNLIVRAEYRYTDFGSEDYAATLNFPAHSVDLKTNDIRLGVSYKF